MLGSVSVRELVVGYFRNLPPRHAMTFLADRRRLAKEHPELRTRPEPDEARRTALVYLADLDERLANSRYFFSNQSPTYADFCAFTQIWYQHSLNQLSLAEGLPHLQRWFSDMNGLGEGNATSVSDEMH